MSLNTDNKQTTIQNKIINFESTIINYARELDIEGSKLLEIESTKKRILSEADSKKTIVKINVGGKVFSFKLTTIINSTNTIFAEMLLNKEWLYKDELFIDRSYDYFGYIACFLRHNNVNIYNLPNEECNLLLEEAEFYNIIPLINIIKNKLNEIYFINLEIGRNVTLNEELIGTNNIEDLNNFKDTSCNKGVVVDKNSFIILELNKLISLKSLIIGAIKNDFFDESKGYGVGAKIETSEDKNTWKQVGQINSDFVNKPVKHSLESSNAKFIKFTNSKYIGLGYCKVVDYSNCD